jgi:hypothetical protein
MFSLYCVCVQVLSILIIALQYPIDGPFVGAQMVRSATREQTRVIIAAEQFSDLPPHAKVSAQSSFHSPPKA